MAWSKELDKNLNKDKFKRQEEAKKESSAPRENAWSGAVTKNNNPNAEFEPSRKSETKGGSSSAKQQSGVKKTSPSAVLGNGTKYFRGFQSYQDRKKNGNVFTPTTVMGNAKNGKIKKGNILPNVSDDLAVKMGTLLTQYEKITNSELTVGERNSAINSLVKENRGVFESYKRETHSDLTIPSLVNMFDREAEKRVEALSKQKSVQPDLRPATLKDLTVNSFQQGFYNANYGKELYKEMSGNKNYADFYGNKLEDDKYRFEPKGLLQKAVSGASRQLGQHSVQATDPTTVSMMGGALAAALVAGNSGPQALLPEEIITGPGAVAMAYKAGSAMSNMKIEAGLAYDEMIKNGISKDTATKIALGVGGVNAALEAMQLDELAKAYTVLGKNPATQNGAKLLMNYALRAGLSLGNEVAQETAQDGVTIAGVQAANKIEKGEWAYDAKEVTGRLGDTALSSTLTFGAMGLPGHFKNLGMAAKNNYDNVSSIGRDFKNMGEVQSVIDTGIKSDKATGAYKYADKMQQKQAAGKELSDWNVGRQWNKNIRAIQSENDFAAAMSNIKPTEIVDRLYAGDTAADVRYSPIEYDKDGNAYVNIKENQGLFEGVDSNQYSKIALNFMNEKYKDKTMSLSDYNLVKADKIGIRKFVHSGKGIDINTYQAKMRASGELHNLLEAAEYIGSSDDEKNHSFAKYGFDYYKTRFIVDGQMFEGIIDIGVSESGSRFYGMTNVKRTSYSSQPSVLLPDVAAELKVGDSFNNIIYKNNGNVKRGLELNGMATSDGVKVSTNGNQSVPETIKHEWSHMFKTLDPEAYSEYEASVIEAAREANSKAVDKRMEFLMNEYGYSEEIAREEIVAELTGGFNTKAIQQMAEGNAALADNLAIAAQRAKTRIKAAFGDGKYTSSTGLQMTFEKLNQAEKMYVDGLNKARNNQTQTADRTESIIRYSASEKESIGIKEQIRQNADKINKLSSVQNFNYQLNPDLSTQEKRNRIIETYKKEHTDADGNAVITRPNFGDVSVGVKDIQKGFRYLKTHEEYVAMLAVPNVIKSGVEIYSNDNHKNRNYSTFTFAAPVTINGVTGNMAVVIKNTGRYKYKMHRILTPDGAVFEFQDNKNSSPKDSSADNYVNGNLSKTTVSNNSISNEGENVKFSVKESTSEAEDSKKLSQLYENTMQKEAFGDEFKSEAESDGNSDKGIDRYTYKALAKKADMPVTILTEEIPLKENGQINRSSVINKSVANVRKYDNPLNTETQSFIYVQDIDKDILIGKTGLRHGLAHNALSNAKVTMQIGDILKNAVAVNELNARGNTDGAYVLMGVGADNEGNYYPTRIIVNNYEIDTIEPLSVLYAINGKKESRSGHPAEFTKNNGFSNDFLSNITISDFLDVVKDYFPDILSQNVLEHYGIDRPKSTLSDSVKYSVKENTDKVSKLYENTMQKDAFTDEFKSEAERRKPEFMYEGITNKETYAAAQSDIARRGDSEILSELLMKNSGWTAEDTAKALALMAQYQSEGNAEKAVDVASMLREKMTRAGQAVQALKIVNKLTPEGQFIDFTRQADKLVDEQIEKHPASEKIRKEIKEAQKKDKITEGHTPEQLRVMREYENAVDGDMQNFIERVRSGENTKYEYRIGKTNDRFNKAILSTFGFDTEGYTHCLAPDAVKHIDKRHGENGKHDKTMNDTKDIQRIGYVLENYDHIYKTNERSSKYSDKNNKKAPVIVITKRVDGTYVIAEAIPDSKNKQVHIISAYKNKAGEVPNNLLKSLGITSENELLPTSYNTISQDGGDVKENTAYKNKAVEQQALIMQAEKSAPPVDVRNVVADTASKNRISQDGGNVKTEYEKVLDKYGIEYLSESELKNTSDTLKQLSELNDKDDLINLILKQSKERKTASHALVKKALEGQDIEFLKDTAIMQVFGKITDKMPVTFAQKASTYQAMSHLLNARTMARNITSNAMFNTVDRISADIGSITDSIMGIFTGRRTVGVDRGVFEKGRFRASLDRATKQYIDIALAVDHESGGSKYNLDSARRTFKGRTGGPERAMSYGLQVTDEWSKGGIEHNVRKSLERLKNSGFTEEEINSIAKYEARYRTFQDDTKLSQVLKGLKDTLNVIGIGETKQLGRLKSHEFGLGDLVQKYTQVPGALITRSVEYSPLGYCKALYHIGQAANNARKGADFSAQAQRNIALSLGRAMTGTGLIALFAGLSKLGIFTGEREDEDEKLKAMENAEGVSNTQLNLSALGRLITDGEADGRQNGDVLTSLGFLEPLNTLMAMGNAIAERGSVKNPVDWAKAAGAKTFDQIMDMSTMSTIRSISNTLQYGGGGTDVAIGVIADSATGFVPSPVRQLGGFLDTVQRNPYNEEDNLARAKERFKATLPWAREDVAAKINPYGEEKTTSSGNRALDFLNNFFSPGSVNIYQTSDISEELYRLAETSTDVLPHVPAKSFTVDKVKFKPRGKDYEKYSRLVGTITAQKMRDIINGDDYSGMSDEEKIDALSTAATEGEKEAKEQYAAGKADDMSAPHFRMTEPAALKKKQEEINEKNERQEKITGQLQAVSDAAAAAVPDKADNYSLKSLQINSIQSVKIDGKSYDLSDEIEDKVISAANEEHYSNIEKLMNNEINIEDIVGYTSKGKARTTTQADGTKVSLTGKMYNDDGTSRFDEIATARIIYHSKEAAKEHAAEKYRNEITGTASQPAEADEPVKVSKGTGGGGRKTISAKASGRKASGGGSKGKSSGGLEKVTFTARAGAGSAATAKRSRTRSVASLPNAVDPQVIQRAVNSFMKNNRVNTIKPLENPLFM